MNRLCNNCTHDVFAFGMVHYIKRAINVMGPSTTRSLSPCHVDGRPIERSADCSIAFPARATPMRPHEPPHDTLSVSTTYLRLAYCMSSRQFNCLPRVRHQSVRVSRRHETSRLHDLLTSGLLSTSRQQPRHHCGRTYSAGGEIMRPTATSVIVLFNPAE